MVKDQKNKKRVAISYHNLSQELQDALKARYPLGFTEEMIRIDKGPGDFFYAVVLETEEINYLVKIDVKIDDGNNMEEEEKDYYDEDIKGAEDISDTSDEDDDE